MAVDGHSVITTMVSVAVEVEEEAAVAVVRVYAPVVDAIMQMEMSEDIVASVIVAGALQDTAVAVAGASIGIDEIAGQTTNVLVVGLESPPQLSVAFLEIHLTPTLLIVRTSTVIFSISTFIHACICNLIH